MNVKFKKGDLGCGGLSAFSRHGGIRRDESTPRDGQIRGVSPPARRLKSTHLTKAPVGYFELRRLPVGDTVPPRRDQPALRTRRQEPLKSRDGLTRSRSLGPRGLLASPRLLSPPPRRLKSQDLQRDFYRGSEELDNSSRYSTGIAGIAAADCEGEEGNMAERD